MAKEFANNDRAKNIHMASLAYGWEATKDRLDTIEKQVNQSGVITKEAVDTLQDIAKDQRSLFDTIASQYDEIEVDNGKFTQGANFDALDEALNYNLDEVFTEMEAFSEIESRINTLSTNSTIEEFTDLHADLFNVASGTTVLNELAQEEIGLLSQEQQESILQSQEVIEATDRSVISSNVSEYIDQQHFPQAVQDITVQLSKQSPSFRGTKNAVADIKEKLYQPMEKAILQTQAQGATFDPIDLDAFGQAQKKLQQVEKDLEENKIDPKDATASLVEVVSDFESVEYKLSSTMDRFKAQKNTPQVQQEETQTISVEEQQAQKQASLVQQKMEQTAELLAMDLELGSKIHDWQKVNNTIKAASEYPGKTIEERVNAYASDLPPGSRQEISDIEKTLQSEEMKILQQKEGELLSAPAQEVENFIPYGFSTDIAKETKQAMKEEQQQAKEEALRREVERSDEQVAEQSRNEDIWKDFERGEEVLSKENSKAAKLLGIENQQDIKNAITAKVESDHMIDNNQTVMPKLSLDNISDKDLDKSFGIMDKIKEMVKTIAKGFKDLVTGGKDVDHKSAISPDAIKSQKNEITR